MRRAFEDVRAFHQKFGQTIGARPGRPYDELLAFRLRLIREEYGELLDAAGVVAEFRDGHHFVFDVERFDLAEFGDALADLAYVTIGAAIAAGVDLREVWDEVHRSNMAKVGGAVRSDGKVLKPDGWEPPDVAGALERGDVRR